MSLFKKFTSKFNKKNQKIIKDNNWNHISQEDNTPWNIEEENEEKSWDNIKEIDNTWSFSEKEISISYPANKQEN